MSLTDDAEQAPRRRRGAELERALLEAAWAELVDQGYGGLTYESVAERAQTSRAVLYRRWPTKAELVAAAVVHAGRADPVTTPDTGTLRGDVIELLRRTNQARARLGIIMTQQLAAYFAETGTAPAALRSAYLEGRDLALDTLIERGVARGEVDPTKIAPRVSGLPFDLYRQELLMTLRPVPDDVIASIVDEVFLPLVRPAARSAAPQTSPTGDQPHQDEAERDTAH